MTHPTLTAPVPLPSFAQPVANAAAVPGLSIVMTVLNAQPFLREAIDSVLAQQTRVCWELLIVDDGSTDDSLSIALEYAERFPGTVLLLRHPGGANRGISASRNLALRHARAAILAFLDADDVWLPHRIESQLGLLHRHPQVSMVYCAAERWCDPSQTFDRARALRASWGGNYIPPLLPPNRLPGLLAPPQLLDWFLADESMVPCICTVLVRTTVARRLGGFENQFRGLYDDQAFHAKIALDGPVYASLDCVARYRQHPGSCCAEGRGHEDRQAEALHHFQRWLAHYRANLQQRKCNLITPHLSLAAAAD